MCTQRLLRGISFFSTLAAVVAASFSSSFFAPTSVQAASYNPGRIIEDSLFLNKESMSVGEIQAFLVTKGSVLATVSPALLGEGANGRSAAQIIFDASRQNVGRFGGIDNFTVVLNPQIIIATLQKETSLISEKSDTSLFRIAMGYACPDSGGCDSAYAGFTNQVTYGAAQLYLNYVKAQNGTSNYLVGSTYTFNDAGSVLRSYCPSTSTTVRVENYATSALFRYTPHACDGNANLWSAMNTWFKPAVYKPVALARDPSDGTVYVVDDNGRWAVTGAGFQAWGFSWNDVQPITADQLQLPVKSRWTQLPVDDNGTVYYIDNGVKRPLVSPQLMDRWHFSWGDVSWLSNAILDRVPYGLPMHELLFPASGDGTVYMATNGQRYPMTADAFRAWGFDLRQAATVPGYTVSSIPVGPLMSRFVMPAGGDGTVFFIDRGYGYKLSGAVAQAWGFDLSQIRTVGIPLLDERGAGGFLTTLVKADQGDGTLYLIQGGKKRPITAKAWSANKFSGSDVRTISSTFLNTIATGDTLK